MIQYCESTGLGLSDLDLSVRLSLYTRHATADLNRRLRTYQPTSLFCDLLSMSATTPIGNGKYAYRVQELRSFEQAFCSKCKRSAVSEGLQPLPP